MKFKVGDKVRVDDFTRVTGATGVVNRALDKGNPHCRDAEYYFVTLDVPYSYGHAGHDTTVTEIGRTASELDIV